MTTRDRQMTQLKSQLAQLEANLVDMSNLMERTTEQALHIRELGILHASIFMSAHAAFENETFQAGQAEEKMMETEYEE